MLNLNNPTFCKDIDYALLLSNWLKHRFMQSQLNYLALSSELQANPNMFHLPQGPLNSSSGSNYYSQPNMIVINPAMAFEEGKRQCQYSPQVLTGGMHQAQDKRIFD